MKKADQDWERITKENLKKWDDERKKLERTIKAAAEEAYNSEVVETDMEGLIGEGKEYASKKDWIETKIAGWEE